MIIKKKRAKAIDENRVKSLENIKAAMNRLAEMAENLTPKELQKTETICETEFEICSIKGECKMQLKRYSKYPPGVVLHSIEVAASNPRIRISSNLDYFKGPIEDFCRYARNEEYRANSLYVDIKECLKANIEECSEYNGITDPDMEDYWERLV